MWVTMPGGRHEIRTSKVGGLGCGTELARGGMCWHLEHGEERAQGDEAELDQLCQQASVAHPRLQRLLTPIPARLSPNSPPTKPCPQVLLRCTFPGLPGLLPLASPTWIDA